MSIKLIKRKRKSLCVIQWFFFSALGCIFPYLTAHMKEIGLTSMETSYLNGITAAISLIGPLIAGPLAHRFNKYQTLIVISLIGSFVSYSSLLFIPRVIRNARHPNIVFDCSNNNLRMEKCPNWNDQCQVPQKAARGNFTNFMLTKCKYHCPAGSSGTLNSTWYPLHVCFISSSEGNLCLVHDPSHVDRGYQTTQIEEEKLIADPLTINERGASPFPSPAGSSSSSPSKQSFVESTDDHLIQFDSRFDRWPINQAKDGNQVNRDQCSYQTLAPLVVNHRLYESIQCRPYVHHCEIHCKVNLLHRPRTSTSQARPPTPCLDIIGDPKVTYYSYLVLRAMADMFMFTALTLIDGLGVTLLSNYDSLYGGKAKVLSIVTPLMVFPALCGFFIDYYSSLAGQPDYSPPFILFDGLILITIALVMAIPVPPIPLTKSMVNIHKSSSQSQTSLRSTPSLRALTMKRSKADKEKIPAKNWYILLLFLFPVTLASGTVWGSLQTFLYPFYISLGASKLWIGISFSFTYSCLAPFVYLAKPLIDGIGRLHLMALCFVFYTLRLTGISIMTSPKWTLLPFEAMEAFTLPLAWLAITSFGHSLITATPARPDPIARSGLNSKDMIASHLKLHYSLHIVHFGLGRVLGSGVVLLWLKQWDDAAGTWFWLDNKELELPEVDSDGFRFLLRLMALATALIAVPMLFFYHATAHIVRCFKDCGSGIRSCTVRCRKCCKTALSSLCCCSCKFNMCKLCKKSRVLGRSRDKSVRQHQVEVQGETTDGSDSDFNGHGHPRNGTLDNHYSRLVSHHHHHHPHLHHSHHHGAGQLAGSRKSLNRSKQSVNGNSMEMVNGTDQIRGSRSNGHRIKMADVVGEEDSLGSVSRSFSPHN